MVFDRTEKKGWPAFKLEKRGDPPSKKQKGKLKERDEVRKTGRQTVK